jgi:hypothetical protein
MYVPISNTNRLLSKHGEGVPKGKKGGIMRYKTELRIKQLIGEALHTHASESVETELDRGLRKKINDMINEEMTRVMRTLFSIEGDWGYDYQTAEYRRTVDKLGPVHQHLVERVVEAVNNSQVKS